ncbi:MAG: uracil-xanthine permease family protein [Proteobacteria bacterium]|nr:uracil-xanthine permease family protein [Pseudomonadota bacterium]MBU1388381.1 uracil-xanthine permease family protein [Pseudomonadota bacterium]MBU1542795.1 uracil-xanthine permease family protein [Pseudomonadota bacterium]MBU2481311.1 uracil-xanthine permease family protein [Pseudomonadota bacterium]
MSESNPSSTEYHFQIKDCFLGAQMLFVAFGALVLVPLLTGLDPNVALFTAGLGTLIFQAITKGRVPIFLASSFAFIAPIIHGVNTWGIPGIMCGLAAAGVVYIILSLIVRIGGVNMVHRILPPVVTGPVIMVIGLILAPVAVSMTMGKTGDSTAVLFDQTQAMIVGLSALAATILVSILGKGILKLIPIICGVIAGYIVALFFGMVDFSGISKAAWFSVPDFVLPEWNLKAIFYVVPIAIAPAIEHFGDVVAISGVTGKDYLKDPGIQNTMLGDGIATSVASFLGGPPNTTYSEVTGAVALTKVFNPAIMTWAAITAILLAFVEKLGAVLQTVPTPVMGGIMLLLFGAIMVVGLNTLVKSGQDLLEARNLAIVALILIFGIGGMRFSAGEFQLQGIGLAGILGVILNLILPGKKPTASS